MERVDVAIIGGGLAGLTLALQLRSSAPSLTLACFEKQPFPASEITHKVGESTVELASYYLRRELGLQGMLAAHHLPKCGLRYFFSNGDNTDIAARVEMGHFRWPLQPSDQLDRGRLENQLAALLYDDPRVDLRHGCPVQEVELSPEGHVLQLADGEAVGCRWLVDASGRSARLQRKLGLEKQLQHGHSAAWFRVEGLVRIDEWSEQPGWRWPMGMRYLATNHLMGRGYWVWLIPLASGATSVGVVFDEQLHPFEQLSTQPAALEWLAAFEPQCAEKLRDHRLLDFRVMRHYARSSLAMVGQPRWALTGEAGFFADPFYSSGADLIAIGNTLICHLIAQDALGHPMGPLMTSTNRRFEEIFQAYFDLYRRQSLVMGHAQAMCAKIAWDFAVYWGVVCPPFFQRRLARLGSLKGSRRVFSHAIALNKVLQQMFWRWSQLEPHKRWSEARVDYGQIQCLQGLLYRLTLPMDDEEFDAHMQLHGRLLGTFAEVLYRGALERCPALANYPGASPQRAGKPPWLPPDPDWIPRKLGSVRSVQDDLLTLWID